jgi:hypothetical protein
VLIVEKSIAASPVEDCACTGEVFVTGQSLQVINIVAKPYHFTLVTLVFDTVFVFPDNFNILQQLNLWQNLEM